MDYFLARYYSNTQGRFLSPDEFTGGPDDLFDFTDAAGSNPTFYADLDNPQSLNKYQYCFNNPLSNVDPDGHSVWTKLIKIAVKTVKTGNVASAVADTFQDAKTLVDPKASTWQKVVAGVSLASELAPVSVGDVKDAIKIGGAIGGAIGALKKVDNSKALINRGGRHGDLVKSIDAHSHHLPAKSHKITPKNDGPAVVIDAKDHRKTRTYGKNEAAIKKEDAGLSSRQILAKDIRELRTKFGSKYRRGSLEAIKYAKTLPEFKKPVKRQYKEVYDHGKVGLSQGADLNDSINN